MVLDRCGLAAHHTADTHCQTLIVMSVTRGSFPSEVEEVVTDRRWRNNSELVPGLRMEVRSCAFGDTVGWSAYLQSTENDLRSLLSRR